jgi:glycosyltransferase involved in cell wall biosynthesis
MDMQTAATELAPPVDGAGLRCLWIARELPFPTNTGDRIYTARLAKALGDAGADVTFVGLEASQERDVPTDWPIRFVGVAGKKRSYWRAVMSSAPLVMAAHTTASFGSCLDDLLNQHWDAIVIDHYGSGWVLDRVKAKCAGTASVLVHIAQNHEESLAYSLYRSAQRQLLTRIYLFQNFLKTRRIERRLVKETDLVSAITVEDRNTFQKVAPATHYIILTPGYAEAAAPPREIGNATSRHVILVGSYRWVVKHENLRLLLRAADAAFAKNGIVLDVIGDVPEQIRDEFAGQLKATHFHGFVDDVAAFKSAARLALVPEVIGGGFKLKFLDYIFGRVPVASISAAAAGLPEEVRAHLLLAPDLDGLVQTVIEHIDRLDLLQDMQQRALDAARSQFDWRDRGVALLAEINRLRLERVVRSAT